MLSFFLFKGAMAQEIKSDTTDIDNNADFIFFKHISGDFQMVRVDVLDNIYLISAGGQLKKLTPNGDSIAVYNQVKKYGNPTYLDVSNPLKSLLYYKNYATVVILDRLLAQRNVINFRKRNIFSVNAIATSYDNQIWIFDEQDFKLKKINEEGNVLMESSDMRQINGETFSPQTIVDADSRVFLYDPDKGFFIFDYYGAFLNHLPLLHWTDIAVSKDRLMGFSDNHLHVYTMKRLQQTDYKLPPLSENRISIMAMNNKLYILKPGGLSIFLVK